MMASPVITYTMTGLIRQGLTCQLCKLHFHKKCAHAPRNECARWNGAADTSNVTGGDAGLELESQSSSARYQLPHTLYVHSYKTPTVCKVCDKLLVGLIKQGLK